MVQACMACVFMATGDTEVKFMTDGVLLKEAEQVRGVIMHVARYHNRND